MQRRITYELSSATNISYSRGLDKHGRPRSSSARERTREERSVPCFSRGINEGCPLELASHPERKRYGDVSSPMRASNKMDACGGSYAHTRTYPRCIDIRVCLCVCVCTDILRGVMCDYASPTRGNSKRKEKKRETLVCAWSTCRGSSGPLDYYSKSKNTLASASGASTDLVFALVLPARERTRGPSSFSLFITPFSP